MKKKLATQRTIRIETFPTRKKNRDIAAVQTDADALAIDGLCGAAYLEPEINLLRLTAGRENEVFNKNKIKGL